MFFILHFFNSILFVFANLFIALYTLQRFFRVMRSHYQLVDEVEEYNSLVNQSRSSLDYVGTKIMEAMKEIEADIGKEVYVTHNLTKLSSKIFETSKRFGELEDEIIQLARLDHNMENATVETPSDINEEVRRILGGRKHSQRSSPVEHQQQSQHQRPRSARLSPSKSKTEPVSPMRSHSKTNKRSLSPGVIPEVTLLAEQRTPDKPIGFRPPWMCV